MIRNSKKLFIVIILSITCFLIPLFNFEMVYADSLSENIEEQLNKIDFGELENFFNSIVSTDIDFYTYVNKLLKGEYSVDYNSIITYAVNTFFSGVLDKLPIFISVIAISILCGITQGAKNNGLTDSVSEITFFVCILGVILLLSTEIFSLYKNIEIIIKNIAKLSEIMSPIIITLMLAVGGNVSASVYKPTVAFLTNGIINVVLCVVLPLIGMMTALNITSSFSSNIKLSKFSDFITSAIKWIIGLIATIFGMFLTVQGITSAHFDGISIKAAKYAISNSIPIVGGFIKDGFDLVVAGSIIIKNSIGVAVIFLLFYMLISPILHLAVISLLLRLTAAIIEPICDSRISNFCVAMSKTTTYLTASLFLVGLMFFLTVLLMTFSASSFV